MRRHAWHRLITASAVAFTVAGLGTADAQNSYVIGYITDLSGPPRILHADLGGDSSFI